MYSSSKTFFLQLQNVCCGSIVGFSGHLQTYFVAFWALVGISKEVAMPGLRWLPNGLDAPKWLNQTCLVFGLDTRLGLVTNQPGWSQ